MRDRRPAGPELKPNLEGARESRPETPALRVSRSGLHREMDASMTSAIAKKVGHCVELVKLQHTVFALPFALMSALIAANGRLAPHQWTWILAAMVGARTSAMGFNRIVDRHIDALNPRTCSRALPAGHLRVAEAWALVLSSAALMFLAAAELNPLALALAPVALAVVWGYSFTKRFTSLSHLVLGAALGIAPAAAWIAVRGSLSLPPLLLAGAVLLWTAGFDILYACQDVEFDRRQGLHSVPCRLGIAPALRISEALHAGMFGLLVALKFAAGLGPVYALGLAGAAALLAWQHHLVRPHDLRRLDAAFFTANGFLSVGLFAITSADLWMRGRF